MSEQARANLEEQTWHDKMVYKARMKMYRALREAIPIDDMQSIVDVGVTANSAQKSYNFFEKMYPFPERITALSDQDASWMENEWVGLKFVQGDARSMPFEDNSFDFCFSSAVIEHVGNRANQKKFISECIRVSKKWVFITTPNRFYPIESHSQLLLVHWLPRKLFERAATALKQKWVSLEENINLLSKRDLKKLIEDIEDDVRCKVKMIYFFGFPSNILLIIEKGYKDTA